MDKKWWSAEQRLCESHGLHILAAKARDIGLGITEAKTPEQRAREYLAQVELNVRRTFSKPGTKTLKMTVKPRS
jgi:hypothetical protein